MGQFSVEIWPVAGSVLSGTQQDTFHLRLAAIFHDLGHGPFSHAIESVLEVVSPLAAPAKPDGGGRREQIGHVKSVNQSHYSLNEAPSVPEIIAVMIVLSEATSSLFASDRFIAEHLGSANEIQEKLVSCIIGAIDGPGADHLSAILSSQLDADRMDYLSRDAHHAGLTIGFDTARLLSRLEVLQMREDNTPCADQATRGRIGHSRPDPVLQIGIAASGFVSFEQMLIGVHSSTIVCITITKFEQRKPWHRGCC